MITQQHRFHGHGSLRYVYKHGQMVRGRLLSIKYVPNPYRRHSRISVVVSKKVLKSAPGRNRIRRRIYEIIRTLLPCMTNGPHDIAVLVFSSEVATLPHTQLYHLVAGQLKDAKIINPWYNSAIMNPRTITDIITKADDYQKDSAIQQIVTALEAGGYTVREVNTSKPWGGYVRLDNDDVAQFVADFFPMISLADAQKGNPNAPLSPKILLVDPELRLSWQRHNRRAECWIFLTDGYYHRSKTDDEGQRQAAQAGELVQFEAGERHRLVGADGTPTVVAEIWQHTDPEHLSDEDDIIRIQDDFSR